MQYAVCLFSRLGPLSEIVSFVRLFDVCIPLNVSFMREHSHLSNPPLNAQHLAKYLAANRCPI